MGGTRKGGLQAAATLKKQHGEDYYRQLGAKGGKNSTTGGWHYMRLNDPELLEQLSREGGKKSRRNKTK